MNNVPNSLHSIPLSSTTRSFVFALLPHLVMIVVLLLDASVQMKTPLNTWRASFVPIRSVLPRLDRRHFLPDGSAWREYYLCINTSRVACCRVQSSVPTNLNGARPWLAICKKRNYDQVLATAFVPSCRRRPESNVDACSDFWSIVAFVEFYYFHCYRYYYLRSLRFRPC